MFVGTKFYPTPEDFIREAHRVGLSKRIAQIPKELEVGKTWVWLAHREVIPGAHAEECAVYHVDANPELKEQIIALGGTPICSCDAKATPGVFHAFVPTRIEYVVKGNETEGELESLAKRGLTLVKIERIGENGELMLDPPPAHDDGDL